MSFSDTASVSTAFVMTGLFLFFGEALLSHIQAYKERFFGSHSKTITVLFY
jgi:hypothetical protein